jgi:hypothetical protein
MKIKKSYLKQLIKEELEIVLLEMMDEEDSEDSYENEPEPPNWLQQAAEEEYSDEEYDTHNLDHTAQMYAAGREELEDEDSEEEKPEEKKGFLANLKKRLGFGEGLEYHINSKTPLTENVYRIGSDSYFDLIKEARVQYKKGIYTPLNEEEREMLESDLGEWGLFEGERVPLDFPMHEETLEEAKKKKKKKKKKDPPIGKPMKNSGGGKKYKVYVRSKSGRIKKISYGDSKGGLKGNWNSAEARKSFASRHKCAEKKDRTKAGYWACRAHKDFGTNVPGRFW